MAQNKILLDEHKVITKTPVESDPGKVHDGGGETAPPLTLLQQTVGNRAVQRLLAQRSGDQPFDLDDETAGRINRERSGGQALDSGVQAQMSEAVGTDFSGVRVHTSAESDALNRALGAKAFTTGQDIFFRQGAYQPHSSGGQQLLAHELTHVVQQSGGAVNSSDGRMHVNAPGDAFEQQADAVARAVTGPAALPTVQRQTEEEDKEAVQMQVAKEEEEEVVQPQELEEEEEVM